MLKAELHFWAALLASACAALIGVGVVNEPYDRVVIGLAAVAGAIAAFNITPPKSQG